MKSENKILTAFLLNFSFSVFEFIGGILTGSVAILSDSLHDLGDAASIGISFFLEKKSKQQPDENYTYGYGRFSVLGSVITTVILLLGSIAVICNAVLRMIHPTEIHHNGMILFAVAGVCINFGAALFTHGGHSLNQKAVNLHMLEDVLGWVVVLIGAIVIKFTGFTLIDPLMSILVAAFILGSAFKNLKESLSLFLEKVPNGITVNQIEELVSQIGGILDIHHIHLWSMDGRNHFTTMHVVTNCDFHEMKEKVREALLSLGIRHVTLELEAKEEHCRHRHCHVEVETGAGHCCHHHHH